MSFVLKDAYVAYSTAASSTGVMTELSPYVKSVALSRSCDAGEDTAMGDNSRSYVGGGLKAWGASITINQDFAALAPGGLGAIWNCLGSTAVWWQFRPVSTTPCSTNPEHRGYGMIIDDPELGGTVGDVATATIELQGLGDLTRGTTTTTAA